MSDPRLVLPAAVLASAVVAAVPWLLDGSSFDHTVAWFVVAILMFFATWAGDEMRREEPGALHGDRCPANDPRKEANR